MLVEYAPCGSLDKVLSNAVAQRTEPSEVVRIAVALQICEAMAQLVVHGVVHRDLASRNVLVFLFSPWDRKEVLVKVTDYGQALLGAGGSRGMTTHSGESARPVRWLSPEALKKRVYSQSSDVWAFGVTLWEVESGADVPYWEEERDAEVAKRVVAQKSNSEWSLLERPDGCGDAVWGVMRKCWEPLVAQRPTFLILKHLLQDALADAMWREKMEKCVMCLERPPCMALRPCGHKCVCAACLGDLRECPMCRAPVEGSLRVFDN
ncbi:tyrosine kinase-domain-containing protein [Baffinella frigidus]|nr:tyrosine kinase-domain-containing protein [Cryptophyta sp. CCMP2293]